MIQLYPLYLGLHTREEAPGAIPNGTRIVKVVAEEGDARPVGSLGVVLGSMKPPPHLGVAFCYFVEWDAMPKVAIGILDYKILRALGD